MKLEPITTQPTMHVLEVDDDDWRAFRPADAARLMALLLAARRFEEAIFMLDRRGLIHGPAHSSIGQEGGAAGCIAALPPDVRINGTHRAHHQVIGKIVHALYEDSFDPTRFNRLPEPMRREVRIMMADILGLADGWTGGRGGSMHLRNAPLGIMGTNPIVGGGMPIACGVAYAEKVRGEGGLMVTFLGEGAIHQGAAHEALHLAALYELPLIFFLENNQYAISMTVADSTRETELLTRPAAHGIPAVKVDGMNPLAVWQAARWATRQIREHRGPAFIHADVYRYYHQSVPHPGSSFGYRTQEEEEAWRRRDPVDFMKRELPERGILSTAELESIDGLVREATDAAVEHVTEGQGSRMRIRPALWPDPASVDEGLSSDLSEMAGARFAEVEDFASDELEETTLIQVMPRVVARRMEQDPSIYVFGEDVANMGGGTVGATRGLPERFPDRIVNTPICENGFCGLAVGAAMSGLKPIIELMYSDFFLVAADQLLNQAGKLRHLFGGTCAVPLVLRCRVPGAEGYGSQHSMDPSGVFALYPGWRIVAPSNAFDYVGLMNAALLCQDPVLVIEHQTLHKHQVKVPKDLDYVIPIGKARRVAEGGQITLIATLTMVDLCREVADEMGVAADVIDLRTLSLRDLDFELMGESVRKTGNVAVVEQSTRGSSIGSLIADEIQRRFFDWLDQPVKRIVGRHAPPTVSKVLEQAALAGRADVEAGIRELLRDSGQHLALAG